MQVDVPQARKCLVYLMPSIQDFHLHVYTDSSLFEISSLQLREIGLLQLAITKSVALILWMLGNPEAVATKIKRAVMILRKRGFRAIWDRLFRADRYPQWIETCDTITDCDRREMKGLLGSLAYQPQISILLPVYNVAEPYLRAAIESVRSQIYPNWQLCIADDDSPSEHIKRVVKEYAALDPRIAYLFRERQGHIAETTNSAATLATGEFVGFLDHDDVLREHALYSMVQELNIHPCVDLMYSDEDKITADGVRHQPHFKSDWNPELILTQNYVCHFTIVRRSLFQALGGIRTGLDGAQDWDLVLRVSEHTSPERIRHIPKILYHWRVIDGSTAKAIDSKPYVTAAQVKAVREHLDRQGEQQAQVEPIPAQPFLRVRFKVPDPPPLVSVIIPTHNQRALLATCLNGLLRQTTYENLEVIVVDNRSEDPATLEFLSAISADPRVSVVRDDGEFNFSRINNRAVSFAKGELVCFLNNDIQISDPAWLREMVSNVLRPGVGIVGARLLYPNGTLQHAGIVLGQSGGAVHLFQYKPAQYAGYFGRAILPQNLSAVTAACLLIRKDVFLDLGGFDELTFAVAYNDVDLCLRARQAGYLIVYTPYAELIHHESQSRGYEDTPDKQARFNREYQALKSRWAEVLLRDPYYNSNCSLRGADFALNFDRPSELKNGP